MTQIKSIKLTALSLFLSTLLSIPINASTIEIESFITGGSSISTNGSWSNTLNHSISPHNENNDQISEWYSNQNDYISFINDENQGFSISMKITDFKYTGNSNEQEDIDASNFRIFGTIDNNIEKEITIGETPNNNIEITSHNCNEPINSIINPHDNFAQPATNFSLTLNKDDKTILSSSSNCINAGKIRFDKSTILIPAGSNIGNYTATITTTITDGTT